MARTPRTLIFADVHLVGRTPPSVTDDLARLIADHPGERFIVVGDLFDLASERPRLPLPRALDAVLGARPTLRAALATHIERGGELWLVAGNHDMEVGHEGFGDTFHAALGAPLEARARVRTSPWFFREGALHIEHGHLYDPDNAPAHPLVSGESSLGGHFIEHFLAPTNAIQYLNVNDATPLKLFLSSFTWYGPRAPYVIYRYFYTAITVMLKSGPFYGADAEIPLGRDRAERLADELGLPHEMMHAVFESAATPTLKSLAATFTRVYFDRVLATLSMAGGLGAAALGRWRGGAAAFVLGGLVMGASWAKGHNRYGGTVPQRLASGAARVAEATGAKLVVFGHSHREDHAEAYANTGSFAFPRDAPGRPYLELEGTPEAPRAVRRYLTAAPRER
jgi:UDP-2,3-diacylglucosamine pyrophosphatase LpxH